MAYINGKEIFFSIINSGSIKDDTEISVGTNLKGKTVLITCVADSFGDQTILSVSSGQYISCFKHGSGDSDAYYETNMSENIFDCYNYEAFEYTFPSDTDAIITVYNKQYVKLSYVE